MRKDCIVISNYHHGEVYETRKEFDQSIFHRVYKRAYDIVQDSVNRQLDDRGTDFFQENVDNIVTFVGRRGTGKSSAMKSFMQGLKDNWREEIPEYTIYNDKKEKVRFIGIDWIDASLLEQGEDIFEEILAKMLKEFLEEDKKSNFSDKHDYDKKDLYRQFDSIYKKHLNIKTRSKIEEFASEMAISNLRDLSRSSDIRQQFQKLVKHYIRMEKEFSDSERSETFLVVAIDDMDMNVCAGFEILEKVQRYLRIKHMIVLLAVNQEQMKLCCERHFAGMFEKQIGYETQNKKKRIGDLADQYMEKALPSYTRVYLPSLKKMDYDRNRVTKIEIEGEHARKVSIKIAMFVNMWKKTRVRYDVEGKKRHFMEPETLRELNNNGIFRKHMKDLVWDKDKPEDFLEQLDFNYRRCMDDLLFRYANEILGEEESQFFLELSELDIRRRGEVLLTRFCNMAEKNREVEPVNYEIEEELREELENGYRKFRYSYGEMLHAIYCLGRMEIYEKTLIHAILAMYSLTLTKIFYRYKAGVNNSEKNGKENQYKMLKELFGDSVGGSWSRKIMPQVSENGESETDPTHIYYAGAAKSAGMTWRIEFTEKLDEIIQEVRTKVQESDEKWDGELAAIKKITQEENKEKEKKTEWEQNIEWELILFLFLSNTKIDRYDVKRECDKTNSEIKSPQEIPVKGSHIEVEIKSVDYNVMNFINNIFLFKDKVKEFARLLCGVEFKEDVVIMDGKEYKKALWNDYKSDFAKEMEDWESEYGGMVVPVYAIDVYYNMFKRLVREQELREKAVIQKDELYDTLINLLDKIENKLIKNDEKYQEAEKFADIFKKCPVIERLRSASKEQIDRYNTVIFELVSNSGNCILEEFEKQQMILRS